LEKLVTIQEGNGGKFSRKFYEEMLVPFFGSQPFEDGDSTEVKLDSGVFAYTADSFTVKPLFFPGGNIGTLCVCGTVNDLASAGAIPHSMSLSLIIEEGFEKSKLIEILSSIAKSAASCNIRIAAGDTKVMEKNTLDGIVISTSGIGSYHRNRPVGRQSMCENDSILVSGPVGNHGMSIFLARNPDIISEGSLQSDCGSVLNLARSSMDVSGEIRIMRDPTRGGLGTVLNEFVSESSLGMEIDERSVPVSSEVNALCEMFGFNYFHLANEGKLVAIAPERDAEKILEIWRAFPEGKEAKCIGKVTKEYPGKVILNMKTGGKKILDMLGHDMLPRIC